MSFHGTGFLRIATLSVRNSVLYGTWKCIILITKDRDYSPTEASRRLQNVLY
jgi:hypothetical protein